MQSDTVSPWISCAAYAKHRGVSKMAVSEAIRAGRLVRSVVRDEHGQPKIGDVALADEEWERNTDSVKRANAAGGIDPRAVAPPAEPGVVEPIAATVESIATATERLKSAQADLAEIKRDEARGLLIPAKDVERRMVEVFAAARTKLLAVPSRAKQQLPHLSTADVSELEKLVREALEDLAAGGA